MYLILFLIGILSQPNKTIAQEVETKVSGELATFYSYSLDSVPPNSTVKVKPLETTKKSRKKKKNKTSTPKKIKAPKAKASSTRAKSKYAIKDTARLSLAEQIRIMAKVPEPTPKPATLVHPATIQQCAMAFDVVDEFTGRQKKGLHPRTFFTFTPEQYRKFLKEEDFIVCKGYLTQSTGELMALTIQLTIASKEAKAKFGAIQPNSALVLHTMDNKDYLLQTYAGAKPTLIDGKVVYECSYSIDKKDLKKLEEAEIDTAKIVFEKGNFTYDVYYLDFLKDQFPCFE